MTTKEPMPKDGFQYAEIHFPHKGVIISGAMDDKSLAKIVDITLAAKVDREYKHPAPDKIVIDRADVPKGLVGIVEKVKKFDSITLPEADRIYQAAALIAAQVKGD